MRLSTKRYSMRAWAAGLMCLMGLSGTAFAQAVIPLELHCDFELFVSAVAGPNSTQFTAEVQPASTADNITYFSIDASGRTAWVEGGGSESGQVVFDAWDATWTFTEYTYKGDIYVTQVFLEDEPNNSRQIYRAVRSKQWTAFGSVLASQYYGVCKAVS